MAILLEVMIIFMVYGNLVSRDTVLQFLVGRTAKFEIEKF